MNHPETPAGAPQPAIGTTVGVDVSKQRLDARSHPSVMWSSKLRPDPGSDSM